MLLKSARDEPSHSHLSLAVQVPSRQADEVRRVFDGCAAAYQDEYGSLEKDMSITLRTGSAAMSMRDESAVQLLNLLCTLPHGVVKYSHDVPGKWQQDCAISQKHSDRDKSAISSCG